MKSAVRLILVIAALVCAPARGQIAPVVSAIPDDCHSFVVIPNMAELSNALDRVGAGVLVREMEEEKVEGDLMSLFLEKVGLEHGIDPAGSAAFGFYLADDDGEQATMIGLMPVADRKAVMGNFGVEPAEDGVTMKAVGSSAGAQTLYYRLAGDYLVMGDDRAAVAGYRTPAAAREIDKSVGLRGVAAMHTAQLFWYTDVDALEATLREKMDGMAAVMEAQADAPGGQAAPPGGGPFGGMGGMMQMSPEMQAYSLASNKAMTDGMRAFVRDALGAVVALNIDDAGLGMISSAQFEEGTELARRFAKRDPAPSLNALPDQPYFIVTSMAFGPNSTITHWQQAIADRLPDENPMKAPTLAGVKLYRMMQGMQFAWYIPEMGGGEAGGGPMGGMMGPEGPDIRMAFTVPADDPEQFLADYGALIQDFGKTGMYTVEYEAGAMELDGRPVDHFNLKVSPEMQQSMGPMAMMMGGGPQGMGGHLTTVDGMVVGTIAKDLSLLKQTVVTAKAGNGTLPRKLAAVRKQVAEDSVMELYFGLGDMLRMVQPMLMFFAPDLANIQIPADLPPIAMTADAGDGAVGGKLFLDRRVLTTMGRFISALNKAEAGGQPGGMMGPPMQQR